MELENLFTVSKWEILSNLSRGKQSPMELSQKLRTTMANISQQLRLLEFAGLVKKEKVSQRDAGKPRTLYFLSDDFAHLVLIGKNCAQKRLLHLNDHHITMLRIWMIDDSSLHYYIEKLYWKIEQSIEQLKFLVVDTKSPEITLYAATDSKELERKLQDTLLRPPQGDLRSFVVKVVPEKEIQGRLDKLAAMHVVYDPKGILLKNEVVINERKGKTP